MQPAISIRALTKHYGQKQVLQNIDLEVMPGQIIGYIGPNGAGKSTTVKILTGILSDFGGVVEVAGFSVRDQPLEVKRRIGYVPELAELYDLLTPREFLLFLGNLHGLGERTVVERAGRILESFGLSGQMDARMDSFSKGMRQKVLITAGLLHNPQVVIMDEPLSGLDANSVIVMKELLQVLKAEGKTIFYSSHLMDVVEKVSDRIVLIDSGRIVADGTIEELRRGGNESLETLFARLTASEAELGDRASSIASALNQS